MEHALTVWITIPVLALAVVLQTVRYWVLMEAMNVNLAQLVVIAVIVIPLVLVSTNRLRLDLAGILTALVLALAQTLGLGVVGKPNDPSSALKALAGLSAPVTVTLFSLFVVTRCLENTGITRWLARHMITIGKASETRMIALVSASSAFFSLFMNNLAAGALVLPSAMEVSRRTGIRPSKLLIPVAYGSCLGGAATYFTTANIIASEMLQEAHPPQQTLHILDFTPTGGLIALAGIIFLALRGSKMLPNHEPSSEQMATRHTGSELESIYRLDRRLWEVRVPEPAGLSDRTLNDFGLGERLGLTVVAIIHESDITFAPPPTQTVSVNDTLLVIGREERVQLLHKEGLEIKKEQSNQTLSARGATFAELVLVPASNAEGQTLKGLAFRRKYGLTVVAIRRNSQSYRTDVANMALQQGDSLLVVGTKESLRFLQRDPDFITIETNPADRPVEWRRASFAVTVTTLAIIASIAGAPVYLCMLLAAFVLIISKIISMEEIYRSMEWQAIILIAGMYPMSTAMVDTGLAQLLGERAVTLCAPFGPLGLVAGAYLFTGLLTQIIGGQVTTLITAPIFISAAISLHTNAQAVAMASAIACSASFLTPLSHPVNALMIGPGNYRFRDFFRAGWGLTILSFIMLLIGTKLFWTL